MRKIVKIRAANVRMDKGDVGLPIKELSWAGETAQWLRALGALPEDPSSIPSTHMVPHNCL